MRAYSIDLRERAVAAVHNGMKKSLVAATFKIGLTTLKRWLLLEQAQHSLASS